MEVDPELVVPDADASLDDGALAPWSSAHTSDYFGRLIQALAETIGFRTDVAWRRLPPRRDVAAAGHPEQVHVRYQNRTGVNGPTTRASKA